MMKMEESLSFCLFSSGGMDFYAPRAQVGKSGMEFFQFLLDGCWLAAVYPNSHEDAVMCTV